MLLLDFTDPGFTDALSEPTEMEYLRKVLFEYMMGRETKVGCVFFIILHKKHCVVIYIIKFASFFSSCFLIYLNVRHRILVFILING